MTAGELAIITAAVLLSMGFAALVVVLSRVLDTLRILRSELTDLRHETRPLLAELRASTDEARGAVEEARHDLDRFDRVLGSAESISHAVASSGRMTRLALSAPVIKATALVTGTGRAARRLRRGGRRENERRTATGQHLVVVDDQRARRRRLG